MDGIMPCYGCGRLPDIWKDEKGEKTMGCLGCGVKIPMDMGFFAALDIWNDTQKMAESGKVEKNEQNISHR